MPEQLYQLTCTEHQLRLISQCVEDCHRFIAGQYELNNTLSCLDNGRELQERLRELKPLITPQIPQPFTSYDWAGTHCPNEHQRRFIAETYPIYREILHQLQIQNPKHDGWNVYNSETLTCNLSGPLIKIKKL